jgi:hypothetical protein
MAHVKMTEAEEEFAKRVLLQMLDAFKEGTNVSNSDFVLRAMALGLAGIMRNCGRNRKEFLHFMARAWDEQLAARRKIDGAS